MEIFDVEVDWMCGYGRNPKLNLLVDKIPDSSTLLYKEKVIGGTILLFTHKEGYVSFMSRPANLSVDVGGFEGRRFVLDVISGNETTIFSFKGAWNGCLKHANPNQFFSPDSFELFLTDDHEMFYEGKKDRFNGFASVALVRDALKWIDDPPAALIDKIAVNGEKKYKITRTDIDNECGICKGFITYGEKKECSFCLGSGLNVPKDGEWNKLSKFFKESKIYRCFSLKLDKTMIVTKRGTSYYVKNENRWARVNPFKLGLTIEGEIKTDLTRNNFKGAKIF